SLVNRGVIQPGERIVAVLTGHLLKDPTVHRGKAPGSTPLDDLVRIDANLGEVERVLRGSGG
ncbi:MAG TPA: hypothetical protein VGQ98_02820, partial [Gemmatimonadaceae bacterium]|nr:hypothetical protein [Gemmatimonadaceae bacterium]